MKPEPKPKLTDLQFLVSRKAVAYVRVSTDDQSDWGTSLDSQKRAIEEYAAANDIEIVDYFEDDFTGRVLDRPGFKQVRKYLHDGLANCLIAHKGDRLTRHRTHLMMILDELQSRGCELHLVTKGQIDLTDDTAILLMSIEGHLAHKELSEIVERSARGRLEKTRQGQIMGAVAPYGYCIEREIITTENGRIVMTGRRLEIEPEEAQVVKLIFELYAYHDYSLNGIAGYLDKNGYLYRTGRRWGVSYVNGILRKTVYKGEYSYGGLVVPVEPIVSPELWDLVEEKRKHNGKHKRHNNKEKFLFSGRVKCHHCGFHAVGSRQYKLHLYRCNCAYSYGVDHFVRAGKYCSNRRYFNAQTVEDTVFGWLQQVLTDKKVLKEGLDSYVEAQMLRYQPMLDDLKRVEKLLAKKLAEKGKLFDAYLEDLFDKDTIKSRQIQLDQEIKSAQSTKADLEQKLEKILALPGQVKTVEELGAIADTAFKLGIPKEKRLELVEALDIQIELEAAEDGLYVHVTSMAGSTLLNLSARNVIIEPSRFSIS